MGDWEKHTKGVGLKILQKFNFKGRLGAKETGIATAIETTARPRGVGLGFDKTSSSNRKEHTREKYSAYKGEKKTNFKYDEETFPVIGNAISNEANEMEGFSYAGAAAIEEKAPTKKKKKGWIYMRYTSHMCSQVLDKSVPPKNKPISLSSLVRRWDNERAQYNKIYGTDDFHGMEEEKKKQNDTSVYSNYNYDEDDTTFE